MSGGLFKMQGSMWFVLRPPTNSVALKYINRSEFVEKGSRYQLSFIEAFEKDFGPTFEPFEGPKWRYRGSWLREEE